MKSRHVVDFSGSAVKTFGATVHGHEAINLALRIPVTAGFRFPRSELDQNQNALARTRTYYFTFVNTWR